MVWKWVPSLIVEHLPVMKPLTTMYKVRRQQRRQAQPISHSHRTLFNDRRSSSWPMIRETKPGLIGRPTWLAAPEVYAGVERCQL